MIKPARLKKGDTIAVLSPSWGGPRLYPHIFEDGIEALENEFGFRVKEFPTARMDPKDLHENPKRRAEDINEAFRDTSVQGIISSIGGDDSIRILEFLDAELIKNNPKLIMGYSDTTTILDFLNLHGLVTYYGSSIMAGFSHIRCFGEAVAEYRDVFFSTDRYELRPFSAWTDSYKNWAETANRGAISELRKDDIGHRWINKGSLSIGQLWGGCIEVLDMMNGTLAWPGKDFWNDKILFFETSEDKPTPSQIGFVIRNWGMQGILSKLKGLLVARPKSYTDDEKAELDNEIKRIVVDEFECEELNIVTNMDFGHTDPRHILPLGIDMKIDPVEERMIFTEALFS
jgi:muramoyltetrapeptide carboxypeptidase LdcA involved in peptidoglycan recycling